MTMGRLEGFLILLGLIACAIESTSGISCYVCNSQYQKDCSSNDKKVLENYKVDCNANQVVVSNWKNQSSNAYLVRLFGDLVREKEVAMSTAIDWKMDYDSRYDRSDRCNTSAGILAKHTVNPKDLSWFDKGFNGDYPKVNYDYDLCESELHVTPLEKPYKQTYYRAKGDSQGTNAKQYDACRIIVMHVKDDMKMGDTEKTSFENRIARTCSTVLEKENSKEYTDEKILEKGCKDYKSAKTEVRVCLCKDKDLCNGTPKGPQSLSIHLILASTIAPIIFRLFCK